MSLLKQITKTKKHFNQKVIETKFQANKNKKHKLKAIYNGAIYAKKLEVED